jgi:hypothetical protein
VYLLFCIETDSTSAADYHSASDDSETDNKFIHRAFSAADAAAMTTSGGYRNMPSGRRCVIMSVLLSILISETS